MYSLFQVQLSCDPHASLGLGTSFSSEKRKVSEIYVQQTVVPENKHSPVSHFFISPRMKLIRRVLINFFWPLAFSLHNPAAVLWTWCPTVPPLLPLGSGFSPQADLTSRASSMTPRDRNKRYVFEKADTMSEWGGVLYFQPSLSSPLGRPVLLISPGSK